MVLAAGWDSPCAGWAAAVRGVRAATTPSPNLFPPNERPVMIHLAALLAATGSSTTAATTATTVASSAHKSSGSILDPIAKPIAWVLAQIYAVIPNYAIAIIVLSVLWMIIISPLTLKSTRSMLA